MSHVPDNDAIAAALERVSDLLEFRGANPFRVRSYRVAATSLREADRQAADLHREAGEEGLRQLPGVGVRLAASIAELLENGRLGLLERLEAETAPEEIFCRLPGVGPTLARRLHEDLGVNTLEELEIAAHNGRLQAVEGIGRRKAAGIADALAGMLGRAGRERARRRARQLGREPSVALLLQLDAEYRGAAADGRLRLIAPRRFNPEHLAWLPILEVQRQGWDFTVLYSNTARAHELGTTHDWVVLYWHREHDDGQATVVTARFGPLHGKRLVRGRESECAEHYRRRAAVAG